MRRIDIIAAIALLAFVGIMLFVVIPTDSEGGVWYGLSPYFYPTVMLGGLAISCIGLLGQAVLRPHLYDDQPAPISWQQFGFFLLAMALIVGGVLIIDKLSNVASLEGYGFMLGGAVLIAAIMVFMGETSPLRILPVALATVAVTGAIIAYGLKTPLP